MSDRSLGRRTLSAMLLAPTLARAQAGPRFETLRRFTSRRRGRASAPMRTASGWWTTG
jgi:hypothetical protein